MLCFWPDLKISDYIWLWEICFLFYLPPYICICPLQNPSQQSVFQLWAKASWGKSFLFFHYWSLHHIIATSHVTESCSAAQPSLTTTVWHTLSPGGRVSVSQSLCSPWRQQTLVGLHDKGHVTSFRGCLPPRRVMQPITHDRVHLMYAYTGINWRVLAVNCCQLHLYIKSIVRPHLHEPELWVHRVDVLQLKSSDLKQEAKQNWARLSKIIKSNLWKTKAKKKRKNKEYLLCNTTE